MPSWSISFRKTGRQADVLDGCQDGAVRSIIREARSMTRS
mgnify:CR=1 FL=1